MVRVRSQHAGGLAAARRLGRSARRFLRVLDRAGDELSILVVGDAAMRSINRQWRGVDRATDVLSFPAAPQPGAGVGLGDLVVSLDTARRQARLAEQPLGAELDRYLAHGLLHLLGFDHERPGQARRMSAREQELLRGEGMLAQAARGSRSRARSGSGSGSGLGSRSGWGSGPRSPSPTRTMRKKAPLSPSGERGRTYRAGSAGEGDRS